MRRYADNFILDEEKEEFIDWHLCANMKRRLLHEEKFTYHYHSVSKEGKDSYYEAYVVKGKTDDETFNAFLGYRNIDNILYKEKEIQEKLRKALDEARLGNEIISSIARTYQYISRIDIQADYFEEISNRVDNFLYNFSFLNSSPIFLYFLNKSFSINSFWLVQSYKSIVICGLHFLSLSFILLFFKYFFIFCILFSDSISNPYCKT